MGSQRVFAFVQSIVLSVVDAPWARNMKMFRTILHAPLYFFLGLSVAFYVRRFWKSVGICSLVAVMDETLKIFLPTREFGALDLLFDAVGFLIGIGIV